MRGVHIFQINDRQTLLISGEFTFRFDIIDLSTWSQTVSQNSPLTGGTCDRTGRSRRRLLRNWKNCRLLLPTRTGASRRVADRSFHCLLGGLLTNLQVSVLIYYYLFGFLTFHDCSTVLKLNISRHKPVLRRQVIIIVAN